MSSETRREALVVENLRVDGIVAKVDIVDEVGFVVAPGTALGIVGESGCGKTTVAMALLGFARPGTRIVSGSIRSTGRTSSRCPTGAARGARAPGLVRPAEPGTRAVAGDARPGAAGRDARRAPAAALRSVGLAPRCVGRGPAARRSRVHAPLSAPAERRSAAACRDRDGTRLPAERDRDGRADDRSRRPHAAAAARGRSAGSARGATSASSTSVTTSASSATSSTTLPSCTPGGSSSTARSTSSSATRSIRTHGGCSRQSRVCTARPVGCAASTARRRAVEPPARLPVRAPL